MLATFPTKDDLSTKVDFPVKLRFTSDTFISSHGANLLHTKETAAFVVVVPLMFLKWTFVIFARFGYTQKKEYFLFCNMKRLQMKLMIHPKVKMSK